MRASATGIAIIVPFMAIAIYDVSLNAMERYVLTIPNLITIARLICVPVLAWLMLEGRFAAAFWLFLIAGLSDALDGVIARWFAQHSDLGAWLDPLADKTLLVTAFAILTIVGMVPVWLFVLVVTRDLFIVSGVALAQWLRQPLTIKPAMVSKATTAFQTILVAMLMAKPGFDWQLPWLASSLIAVTAALTAASFATYAMVWFRHMGQDKDTAGS